MFYKKYSFVFVFLFYTITAVAQDTTGIRFLSNEQWADVLKAAKEKNKLIFIDIYTEWCVPCKRMSQDVFTLPKVGEKFNSSFINYKVDAEKGEGITLAKQYKVQAFPTYLFVDGNGVLFYTVTGYMPSQQFMQQANIAQSEFKDPKPLFKWEAEYDTRKNEPRFLFDYIQKRGRLKIDNTALIEDYFNLIPESEWLTHDNVLLLAKNPKIRINSPVYVYFAKNIEKAEMLIKGEVFPGILHDALYDIQVRMLSKYAGEKDEKSFLKEILKVNQLMPDLVSTKPWFKKPMDDYLRLQFYKEAKMADKFLAIANYYYDKELMRLSKQQILAEDSLLAVKAFTIYTDTSYVSKEFQKGGFLDYAKQMFKEYYSNQVRSQLTAAAEIALFNSNSTAMLSKALKWVKKSNEIRPAPEDMYIQGLLHYRLKKKNEAIQWLEKAKEAVKEGVLQNKIDIALAAVKAGKAFKTFVNEVKIN